MTSCRSAGEPARRRSSVRGSAKTAARARLRFATSYSSTWRLPSGFNATVLQPELRARARTATTWNTTARSIRCRYCRDFARAHVLTPAHAESSWSRAVTTGKIKRMHERAAFDRSKQARLVVTPLRVRRTRAIERCIKATYREGRHEWAAREDRLKSTVSSVRGKSETRADRSFPRHKDRWSAIISTRHFSIRPLPKYCAWHYRAFRPLRPVGFLAIDIIRSLLSEINRQSSILGCTSGMPGRS